MLQDKSEYSNIASNTLLPLKNCRYLSNSKHADNGNMAKKKARNT
jgi:hypothetical protein